MKCSQCGLDNPDQGNFCLHCGKPLTAQGQVISANTPAPPAEDPNEATVRFIPEDQMKEVVHFNESPSMRPAIPYMILVAIIGIVVAVALAFVGSQTAGAVFLGMTFMQVIVIGIMLILLLFLWLKYLIRVLSTTYKLTSQRIFTVRGLLNKRTDELELEKYKDVIVHQSFMNKLMGCGDVQIVTGDLTCPTVDMIDVIDPIGKKEIIRSAARQRKSDLGINRREEL